MTNKLPVRRMLVFRLPCAWRNNTLKGSIGVEILNALERAEDANVAGTGQGTGLLGLREWVRALGGTMEAGSLPLSGKPHFRLRVELPMQLQMEARAMEEERA